MESIKIVVSENSQQINAKENIKSKENIRTNRKIKIATLSRNEPVGP